MKKWTKDNPGTSDDDIYEEFEAIITEARENNVKVSWHLDRGRARDVTFSRRPTKEEQDQLLSILLSLGLSVIFEGDHWHVDDRPNQLRDPRTR